MTEPTEEERGKRKAASRFELVALADVVGVISMIVFADIDASQSAALTGFGTTVFLVCLGYAASLRGIDAYASTIAGKS